MAGTSAAGTSAGSSRPRSLAQLDQVIDIRPAARRAMVLAIAILIAAACGPGGSTGSPVPTGSGVPASPGATASTVAPQDELSHPPESPIATLPASVGYDLQEQRP